MIDFLPLVPYPKALRRQDNRIALPAELQPPSKAWADVAAAFAETVRAARQIDVTAGENGILLCEEPELSEGEYRLECRNRASVFFSGREGLCYGLATLLQLLGPGPGFDLPEVVIRDRPDWKFRGFMIDLGREWHPFDALLRYVDLCFFYKLRYLHLHFTDNGLFTFPSRRFPELPTPACHYTAEQLAQLNQYAWARGVVLIPEIDLPGHAESILRPSKGRFGDDSCHRYALCMGKPDTGELFRGLIEELCEFFPHSPYLHIGGDEVPLDEWGRCPHCREAMGRRGIASAQELYSRTVGELAAEVLRQGRIPIVWEGFAPDGAWAVPKETLVEVFECQYNLPQALIDSGFTVINTSWVPLYHTPYYSWPDVELFSWDPGLWRNWSSASAAYPNGLRVVSTESVAGGQACCWCCRWEDELPRVADLAAALSERLWNREDIRGSLDYEARRNALRNMLGHFLKIENCGEGN